MSEPEIIEPESKMGRPSEYSEELFNIICDRMSAGGTLRQICRDPELPSRETVLRWVRNDDGRRKLYEMARQAQADWYADEIVEVSRNRDGDTFTDADGKKSSNHAAVQRDKLICDNLKFLMAKLHPRQYGDKTELLVGAKDLQEQPTTFKLGFAPSINLIVYPMRDEQDRLLVPGTEAHNAAIDAAIERIKTMEQSGQLRIRDAYNKETITGTHAYIEAEIGFDIKHRNHSEKEGPAAPPAPPKAITYQPAPPPADLTPEAWARITRVSDLIEQIAPSDEMPEAVFGVIEAALRRHYLGAADAA